jgi:hypothetical protein
MWDRMRKERAIEMIAQKIKTMLRLAIALAAMAAATPALAQASYDADCNVVPPDSDRAFEINICRSHLACDIIFRGDAAGCKVKNFLKKATDIFATKGTLDAKDVEQAAKPDRADTMTPSMRSHAAVMVTPEERARRDKEEHEFQMRTTNAANDGPGFRPDETVLPPTRQGGYINLFEGKGGSTDGKPDGLQGEGVLIAEDQVAKGNFKNGKLEGEGEQILSDGTYRGGNYQGGEIDGKGFEFGEKDGKTNVTEGNFKGDVPDGMATVTYDDGTSERVRWENGKIVSHGSLADAGEVPDDPKQISDVALAIAGRQPSDYVIGNLDNGTGMIERVREDGTAQYEEWEDGHIVQVGVRDKKGDALAPQLRPNAKKHEFHGNGPLQPDPPRRVAQAAPPASYDGVPRDGEWAGETSGNHVAMQIRPDGNLAVEAVTHNANQSNAAIFVRAGNGKYLMAFPNGQNAVIQMIGPDHLRTTNPDGWTDTFRLVAAFVAPAPPPPPPPAAQTPAAQAPTAQAPGCSLSDAASGRCGGKPYWQ